MNETLPPFLDNGLSVYAKARDTIAFFEQEIGKLLFATLERRESWPFLETHRISRPKGDKTTGENGYWIQCDIEAVSHSKEEINIECGIWWRASENNHPIIYGCFQKPESRLIFSWPHQENGIYSFCAWKRTHLYLHVTKSMEVGDDLNRILDELLKLLG